ncbi:MAG: dienelactone hydrolase family protein [Devosia sp.]
MTALSGPMLPLLSGKPPKQLMVLLHGYGSDGTDLIGLGREWRSLFPDMAFIAPNGPTICARNPSGYEWFPLVDDGVALRREDADAARPGIMTFLNDLWTQTGLGPADTVLCGFSQGAMMALNVATAMPQPVLAVLAFSGLFIPSDAFDAERGAKPPIALIHGEVDGVVPAAASRGAAELLSGRGFDVRLHISPGVPHGIAPDGLDFASSFLVAEMVAKA